MDINYEYYKIFYYVARYKNLTKAAQILHNNQPNVSRTMKLLEYELGCKLMTRSNRGITLTAEGTQLYSRIKFAVEQIQSAENELLRSVKLDQGNISISGSESALQTFFPVLNHFRNNYPSIRIQILNNSTIQSIDAVNHGLIDFALATSPVHIEKPAIAYRLRDFSDKLICGYAYEHLKDREISLKDLKKYPFVCLGKNTTMYSFYEKVFYDNHLVFSIDNIASTTAQLVPMIKYNLGIGFVPEIFADEALEKGDVFQINTKEAIPKRQIYFVENENRPLSFAAKELKKMLIMCST